MALPQKLSSHHMQRLGQQHIQLRTPLAPRCRSPLSVAACRTARSAQRTQQTATADLLTATATAVSVEQQQPTATQWLPTAATSTLVASLLAAVAAGPAHAEDAAGGPTDIVVTLLAGSVFVLLLLVTAGVAYLNLSSWLDDRQEKKDRDGPALVSSATSSAASEPEPEKKRVRVKREKKGFAKTGGGN